MMCIVAMVYANICSAQAHVAKAFIIVCFTAPPSVSAVMRLPSLSPRSRVETLCRAVVAGSLDPGDR